MKKRLILESTAIALLLMVMTSTTVFASWPGPDSASDTKSGWGGAWVGCAVTAQYGGQYYYDHTEYVSTRGVYGSAQIDGDMQYEWYFGSAFVWGTTSANYISGYKDWNCNLAATYTYSPFSICAWPFGTFHFYVDHHVFVQASS